MPETLTTDELLREVSRLTADLPVEDGRVAKALTERNVRYYVTIGVVRPPAREANRRVWTRDHVLDLVRVRRAQALGMSLKLIGSPTGGQPVSTIGAAHDTASRAGWRTANSPALRNVAGGGRDVEWADTGWTVRLAPDLLLSGFGPMLDENELAAVRGALPRRFAAPTTTDTPPRKDDHR